MEIERKLKEMGFEVPVPPKPVANYIASVQVGNILFVGGNTGSVNGRRKYLGKVGDTVTVEQAYEMARFCGLNHLAFMKAALGDLDRVERIVKLTGYVNVAPGFKDMARVINGESDLYVSLWDDCGRHARAAIGVASLGGDAPVETEVIVQVRT